MKEVRRLWSGAKTEAAIFAITVATIVSVDLLVGVGVGIALSAIKLLHRFSRLKVDAQVSEDGSQATVVLRGTATFLRIPLLARHLENVPRGADVHVDLHGLLHIDHACLELLRNWSEQHENGGGAVTLDWKLVEHRFDQLVDPREMETAKV
jgi:MFS superfamily sulfate permease-like transporter